VLSASRIRDRQEGAVAIFVAIMLVVFLAAVALAVDVGGLYLRRRALVNGSDAASLSAARTCAREGHTPADPFADPEVAADRQVQLNAPISAAEVADPNNVTDRPPVCGDQYGHVTVQYTSQQDLYFAPVLGFDHTSPVTTTATASWGLGSNNPVPTVVSNLFAPGTCQMPPGGSAPHIGDPCVFWYDNDALNGGNFTFLSLNPAGWDVPIASNCTGSQSGGTSTLTKWVNGSLPVSVVLNWRYPTYVCTDTGIRGVGGKGGPNSQVWSAFASLQGQIKDFPINWEGCGNPVTPCAPPGSPISQGTVYKNGNIDKYDIVGFAAMQIDQVYGSTDPQVQGTPAADYTCDRRVPNNRTIQPGTYDWITLGGMLNGGPCTLPASLPVDSVTSVNIQGNAAPGDYTYDTSGITVKTPIPAQSSVKFTLHDDATNGVCGPQPPNNSAVCIITTWKGSTLTGDYPSDRLDDITIVRLCDLAYNSCLDQRPR
jgi:Flp pilus assembly protein TadG